MSAQVVSLEEVADVTLGRQRSPKNHDGPNMRKYLRAANVGWSGLLLDDVKSMNFTDAEMAQFRLEPADILLNEASGSPREVGKPAIWQGEFEECAFQNTLLRVRPHGDVDPRYLLHFFRREAETGAFVRGARGTGINHLGRAALAKWKVPLPRIEEQRRIAAILDHADVLRARRREALVRLDELTQSIFIDMFGDPLTNPKNWATSTIGAVTVVQGGLQVTSARAKNPVSVPYLRVANVMRGHLNLDEFKTMNVTPAEMERTRLDAGDLLVVEGHGNANEIGRVAVWDGSIPEVTHQNHLIRVRCYDVIQPQFAAHYLNSAGGRRHLLRSAKTTSGLNTISAAQVKSAPIVLPPDDVQRRFVCTLEMVMSMGAHHRTTLAELDALFASLQSRAFRGEL